MDDLAGLFGSSDSKPTNATQQASTFAAQQQKASTAEILSMFNQPPAQNPALSQPHPRPIAPGYGSYSSVSSVGLVDGGTMGGVGQWHAPGQAGYQAQMGGQIMLPGTPQNQMKALSLGGSRTGTPSIGANPPVAPTATATNTTTNPQKDPFADLAGLF